HWLRSVWQGKGVRSCGRRGLRRRPAVEALEDRRLLAAGGGNAVIAWDNIALDAIRVDKTTPPLAARDLAIMSVAVYDAVNAIDGTHRAYQVRLRAPAGASEAAAVDQAAYQTLSALFPAQQATFRTALDTLLRRIPNGPAKFEGL